MHRLQLVLVLPLIFLFWAEGLTLGLLLRQTGRERQQSWRPDTAAAILNGVFGPNPMGSILVSSSLAVGFSSLLLSGLSLLVTEVLFFGLSFPLFVAGILISMVRPRWALPRWMREPVARGHGSKVPRKITVWFERDPIHLWAVSVAGPDIPQLPASSDADFDALAQVTDRAIQEHYAGVVPVEGIAVEYLWWPWGDRDGDEVAGGRKIPEELGPAPIFDIRREPSGYSAMLDGDPTFVAWAGRLRDLPGATAAEVVKRWPILSDVPPFGALCWSRRLGDAGLADSDRSSEDSDREETSLAQLETGSGETGTYSP